MHTKYNMVFLYPFYTLLSIYLHYNCMTLLKVFTGLSGALNQMFLTDVRATHAELKVLLQQWSQAQ